MATVKCRIKSKNVKEGPLGVINIHSDAKFQENDRGNFWCNQKSFEKSLIAAIAIHMPKSGTYHQV